MVQEEAEKTEVYETEILAALGPVREGVAIPSMRVHEKLCQLTTPLQLLPVLLDQNSPTMHAYQIVNCAGLIDKPNSGRSKSLATHLHGVSNDVVLEE